MQSLNIYFTGVNRVEMRREETPEPGPGQVAVQAAKTLISTGTEGICLARLFEPGTGWDNWVKYPFSPGYSMAGTVAAVGSDVQSVKAGDRVAVRAPHRQYIVTSASSLYPLPEGVANEDATWFGLANIVQNGVRAASHALGEAVVVIGLGLLGQLTVQYLRLLGAREVIAVDTAPMRLEMAKAHGATVTLQMGAEEAREEVLRLTDGAGAEVVYDVTGNYAVFPHALRMLRKFGRLIILGDTGTPSRQVLTHDVINKGLRIIGAHDANPPAVSTDHAFWSHPQMARLYFTYLQRGDMRVSDLVTHTYSPADASKAYRMLREERAAAMGVQFDWSRV
jgi:2-desacetyl-2-hydroxyethyl bacteriochlorophyllide A dehydrogenase